MFAAGTIIAAIILCMALLVWAAAYAERKSAQGKDLTNNGVVYALSIGIFYSAWTYYGSVGLAARSGFLFFTFYIGATLAAMLWWIYLRKLVRIKKEFRLTSIADFVAARYGKSQLIAAIITLTIIVGIAPYIALQLKAIRTTYTIIAAPLTSFQWIGQDVTPIVVLFMIAFTIMFGVRYVDPTKRHSGMVMSVALESLIQLIFFLIAGVFVVFFVFNGFGDIFQKLQDSALDIKMPLRQTPSPFLTWSTFIVLAMSAVLFLPRQFHIGVVELSSEKNIRPAMWIFPLYTFLTALFMFPIAMAGLLKGLPLETADSFVLAVPAKYGSPWISLLIFVGGFCAATSMIMISSMTLGTMITNHLVLPLLGTVQNLRFLQRHLLSIKRSAVAVVILLGYTADIMLGNTYALVQIGIMSFAVAAQFAPVIIGGIFWRRASKAGALLGMGSGVLIWLYTILMPAFARSGWFPMTWLENGPWGIELLRPEHLLGVGGMHSIVHGTMWSLLFNIIFYILGSLYFSQDQDERCLADSFVDILIPRRIWNTSGVNVPRCIDLFQKINLIKKRLSQFFTKPQITEIIDAGIEKAAIKGEEQITVLDLAEMASEIQKRLGGAIGSTTAHMVLNDDSIYTPDELKALKETYTSILLTLKVSPEELMHKINYHQEKEKLLTGHAEALGEKVRELKVEILERKRVQAALEKNEKELQVILESNPDPVVVYDSEGRTLFVNPAFTRVFGWEFDEVKGRNIPFVPKSQKANSAKYIQGSLAQDRQVSFETQLLTKSGQILDVVVSAATAPGDGGKSGRIIVNVRDITEKLRMKDQVQRTQKMQALGTLAGGIAHDFNNILAAICGFTELAMDYAQDGTILKDNLNDVLLSGQRAKELVKQILTFSRQSENEKKPIKVKPQVKEVLNLIRSSLPTTIEIRRELQSNALINGDAIQIHQVVMNLCTNAGHAMSKKGGVLEVSLEDIQIEPGFAAAYADLKPGPYIKLSVGDNGCGMPADVLNRIFEPFFTTKVEGEGTGMGLSVVHGIVKSHGGEIVVRSESGNGTVVDIFLPSIQMPDDPQKEIETKVPHGTERILFVDDEVLIGRMSKQLLDGLGYEATIRTSSVEALELFKAKPNYFDLVITDMTMPNITGDELARQIKTIRPELPIILCTGFSANIDQKQAEDLGVQGFLLKPITRSEMAWQIRFVLDQKKN